MGCGPKHTYPAARVTQSIEEILKKENKIDASARIVGATIGVVTYTRLTKDGQIPREVHEMMGKVLQTVQRVGLSTDLPVRFAMVSIRDRKSPNELVLVRSMEDIRRVNAEAIGWEESLNRTLFNPSTYTPGEESFVVEDIREEDFLARQMAQRIRHYFTKDDPVQEGQDPAAAAQPLVLADGAYNPSDRHFRLAVLVLKPGDPRESMTQMLKIAAQVLSGYKYRNYDFVEIQDYMNRQKLLVPREALVKFSQKKLTADEVLRRYLVESQSIQEAFKLFGFNIPPQDSDTPAEASFPRQA